MGTIVLVEKKNGLKPPLRAQNRYTLWNVLFYWDYKIGTALNRDTQLEGGLRSLWHHNILDMSKTLTPYLWNMSQIICDSCYMPICISWNISLFGAPFAHLAIWHGSIEKYILLPSRVKMYPKVDIIFMFFKRKVIQKKILL